ncbi:hypothetical protein [Roseicyclus mahoneyensis]|uniref:Uncharacterized protein n=1 Tax=Roseicyclus mahoneyensis TaxID=164332 RepID=A0A316GJP2_9RHOB|nr:hypothetical protein [Roseicyclus mahoneyensis]PWK61234.1 hypothetical protein C7455_103438 [Roseicyclus mahoneyensis]
MAKDLKMDPDIETPITALETALQVPFREQYVQKIQIDMGLVERLYWTLKAHHTRHRVEKDGGLFRPNLNFVGFGHGAMCRRDFDGLRVGDFLPRVGDLEIQDDWIKSCLLFSDEVLIEDPIFAFCRWVLVEPTSMPNFPALRENLLKLCSMRPLLEARLLRMTAFFPEPIRGAESRIQFNDDGSLTIGKVSAVTRFQNQGAVEHALAAMGVKVPAQVKDSEWADAYLSIPNEEDFNWLYIQSESMIYARDDGAPFQPFLYGPYQADLFTKLVKIAPETYFSEMVRCQDLSKVNSHCSIAANDLKMADLVSIRKDEEVFERWRQTVRACMDRTREHVKKGFSEPQIFAQQMAEAEREWISDIKKSRKGVIGSITTEGNSICVGAVGAVLGAVFTGGNPIGAAAGALGGSAIGVLMKSLSQAERFEAEKAAASFFVTFNPPDIR